jgi:hypothetical protein
MFAQAHEVQRRQEIQCRRDNAQLQNDFEIGDRYISAIGPYWYHLDILSSPCRKITGLWQNQNL